MSGIDYSKWDKFDAGSSSDEDEKEPSSKVTMLDEPSTVTFGGGGGVDIKPAASTQKSSTNVINATAATSGSGNSDGDSWTQNGGKVVTKQDGHPIVWSQDRYSVTLRFELRDDDNVFPSSCVKIVHDGILPYPDRFHGVGSQKPTLKILNKTATWFEGSLPHNVHFSQDDEDHTLEWSVERSRASRFLIITLYKAVPMQGMFLWWKRPFMEFEEIEPRSEEGDVGKDNTTAFAAAWEEAHKQFREKKRSGPSPLP